LRGSPQLSLARELLKPIQTTTIMQDFLESETFLKHNQIVPALYVVATPIGNFGDITLRAINVLKECDFVVCEDSRVTAKLLSILGVKKPFLIYNDHSDNFAREKILNQILQGKSLALVSDAGTPLISDPGYKLVSFLLEHNCQVLSVPGACSAIAALSVSGIASDRFMFSGFIPSASQAKENFFKELLNIDSTLIFFETSHRLITSLEAMLKVFGNRTAAVSRELTKIYEQTKKASLQDLIDYYQTSPAKGEIVILLSPPNKKSQIDFAEIDAELKSGLKKMKPKDLVAMVADNLSVNKKVVYQRMLEIIKDE
jgi:16S rRNA (cytidine1402-2'-O)-methyltransferase